MSSPRISVLVPCYNVANYLEQCLASIEGQDFDDLEIICINDGSTDDSLSLMQSHAAKDKRVKVVDKANGGYGAAMNRGLSEACGDYIAIVEPDDWIEQGMYSQMLAFAAQHSNAASPDPDIIKTPYWRIVAPDTKYQEQLQCGYHGRIKPKIQPFAIAEAPHLLEHHPSIWSALYKRAFLKDFNIQFKEIPGAGWADNPFLMATFLRARSIVYLDKPFYCYREETPEKTAAVMTRQWDLPFERWHDMTDIIYALGVNDEAVLRSHYSRAITYLGGVLCFNSLDNPKVRDAAQRMFARMDTAVLFNDPKIPPRFKVLAGHLLGVEPKPLKRLPYAFSLIREGVFELGNLGIRHTWGRVCQFFVQNKSLIPNPRK